jgi:hypothetical protein
MKQRAIFPFLLFFQLFLSIHSFAQFDKIVPEMSLDAFKKNFPNAKEQVEYNVYCDNKGIKYSRDPSYYRIRLDTARWYVFYSMGVVGPCAKFPLEDSSEYFNLMNAAKEACQLYSDSFGKPNVFLIRSPFDTVPNDSNGISNVFYAQWKWGNENLTITVSHHLKSENYPGSYEYGGMQPETIEKYYYMQIQTKGNGKHLRQVFGIGMSTDEFIKFKADTRAETAFCYYQSNISSQIKHHKELPDEWVMSDSCGEWHFSFVENKLIGFDLTMQDGSQPYYENMLPPPFILGQENKIDSISWKNYEEQMDNSPDAKYSRMADQTLKLGKAIELKYGKPNSATNNIISSYPGPVACNEVCGRMYYQATWTVGDQKISMTFNESDIGSSIFFDLTIEFPEGEYQERSLEER